MERWENNISRGILRERGERGIIVKGRRGREVIVKGMEGRRSNTEEKEGKGGVIVKGMRGRGSNSVGKEVKKWKQGVILKERRVERKIILRGWREGERVTL